MKSASRQNKRRYRKSVGVLPMAPMIDVIFLLLIFFFITGKFQAVENSLPIQLAGAVTVDEAILNVEPLVINIESEAHGCAVKIATQKTITLEPENISAELDELLSTMEQVLSMQQRKLCDPIEIICERQVQWDYVAKIYNVLYGAGLSDITFRMTQ
jgi:biopolymer transport protein ExbD